MRERQWRVGYDLIFADGKKPDREVVIVYQGTEAECRAVYAELRIGGFESSKRIIESCSVLLQPEPEPVVPE